jgi:hypothetical protein
MPFINATSTTYASPWQSGQDELALLSTVHKLPAGGVDGNTPSTGTNFSIAALQASILRMKQTLNGRGLTDAQTPSKLVYPTASMFLVGEIFGTDKVPYSADNTKNVTITGITPVEWTRLPANSWFLMAEKAGSLGQKGHSATAVWRIKPTFGRDNNFETGGRKYSGRFRLGIFFPDWRGIDGSLGA